MSEGIYQVITFMSLNAFSRALVSLISNHRGLLISKGLSKCELIDETRVTYKIGAQLGEGCSVLAIALKLTAIFGVMRVLAAMEGADVMPCHGSNTHHNVREGFLSG
jgi:hypothetical protein